ncbi:hypothetical protein SCATT_08180 [Streptantibioticus cattleyicolor NRRL 8057 = DSM 46488]|uniref:Uncharacterized protein n=1 Tax=Streptantibioticus cattleyicolor (strain ATCC 35852 / DSM 46488 / JCM 4925 / NBRC 14057 / NRRL 8057) TaxID=1003195 RepID=G8WZ03_STREN|nr:hypothetical protein SCATT_08180 [Streptantibioticus cattleyicolor NRRL 8057 = DSM 46488]
MPAEVHIGTPVQKRITRHSVTVTIPGGARQASPVMWDGDHRVRHRPRRAATYRGRDRAHDRDRPRRGW